MSNAEATTFAASRLPTCTASWAEGALLDRGVSLHGPIADLIDELADAIESHVGTPGDDDDVAWERIWARADTIAFKVAR